MAAKKGQKGKARNKAGGKAGGNKSSYITAVAAKNSSSSSSSSPFILIRSALPGIILAAAGALWSRVSWNNETDDKSSVQPPSDVPPERELANMLNPKPGTWSHGYYTTEDADQAASSTHALMYQNGGGGEPELISFSSEDDFFSHGRLYNDLGQIVQSRAHFLNGTALYEGPQVAGTHFQWPPVHVGYKRAIPGLHGRNGKQIELETLTEPSPDASSSDPRVFYIHNFLSPEEADEFVRYSTADENQYKMAPSTGGTHKAWNQGGDAARLTTRTSENAFDIATENSKRVKHRAFRLLRMGAYAESLADGIQILRYELGQAYVAHHDYFPLGQSADHQWDPSKGGSNRFATIFLYLSDVETGGETAFPMMNRLTADKSEELVKRLGDAPSMEKRKDFIKDAGLSAGSWEEKLTMACYDKFAVPPRRGDAILFYSQRPDGELDVNSLHGACPVLKASAVISLLM